MNTYYHPDTLLALGKAQMKDFSRERQRITRAEEARPPRMAVILSAIRASGYYHRMTAKVLATGRWINFMLLKRNPESTP